MPHPTWFFWSLNDCPGPLTLNYPTTFFQCGNYWSYSQPGEKWMDIWNMQWDFVSNLLGVSLRFWPFWGQRVLTWEVNLPAGISTSIKVSSFLAGLFIGDVFPYCLLPSHLHTLNYQIMAFRDGKKNLTRCDIWLGIAFALLLLLLLIIIFLQYWRLSLGTGAW